MTDTQEEIQQAVVRLGLSTDQFQQLTETEGERIYRTAFKEFVTSNIEIRWWWEQLRKPCESFRHDGNGLALLTNLVPNPDASIYFIAEDDAAPFYPVYVSTTRVVLSVLEECFGFEYYLTPPDFSWLLGENHHNYFFGVGDPIVQLLAHHRG